MSISFTVRPPSAPHRPSPLANGSRNGPPSRRMFEEHDGEDDERSSHRDRRKDERVDGFRNGRSHGEPKETPMVIPSLPNRDWRSTVQRRTPSYRPEGRQQDGELVTHERSGDQLQRSGIRHIVKTELNGNVKTEEVVVTGESSTPAKTEPMTLEQQALAEILAGDQKTETEEERAQREMVIAMREGKEMTEDKAFKSDVDTLPDESTLEDYAAVPVSAFGLAMVRGMGYDPKASSGTVIHEPKLRPQLLGLGATPMDTTIRPTHNRTKSAKDKQAERKAKSGRGFNAANLLVKQEREGSSSVTPSGSRLQSPNGSEKRRDRDDDYDSGREVKRERSDANGDGYRSRDSNGDGYRSRNSNGDAFRSRDRDNGDDNRSRDRDRRRESEYETEEERAARKARERRARERDYETEEERARRKERERLDRDRRDDRDRDRHRGDRG